MSPYREVMVVMVNLEMMVQMVPMENMAHLVPLDPPDSQEHQPMCPL